MPSNSSSRVSGAVCFAVSVSLAIERDRRTVEVRASRGGREHIYPFAARPVPYGRNSLATSPNINLDLRVLKMVPVGKGHVDIVAESFNLLNHRNVSLLNTVFGSNAQAQSGYGRPTVTSSARRIQFSLDYEF